MPVHSSALDTVLAHAASTPLFTNSRLSSECLARLSPRRRLLPPVIVQSTPFCAQSRPLASTSRQLFIPSFVLYTLHSSFTTRSFSLLSQPLPRTQHSLTVLPHSTASTSLLLRLRPRIDSPEAASQDEENDNETVSTTASTDQIASRSSLSAGCRLVMSAELEVL